MDGDVATAAGDRYAAPAWRHDVDRIPGLLIRASSAPDRRPTFRNTQHPPADAIALIVLGMQIALGGWVSTTYAALACVDFPACHGTWKPTTGFIQGFHFLRELGMTAEGAPLSN